MGYIRKEGSKSIEQNTGNNEEDTGTKINKRKKRNKKMRI